MKEIADFAIDELAVEKALKKWDGIETTASDCFFLHEFSEGSISQKTLKLFSATNTERRRTGGYSIGRTFWGGISAWAPRIDTFAKEKVANYRVNYSQCGKRSIAFNIFDELANMEGTGPSGKKRKLGTVSASKIAFFLCPEMPFFIYDSVVGTSLGLKSPPKPNEYPAWCDGLSQLLPEPDSFRELVPRKRLQEFSHRLDWLARRSLDLALYEIGS